MGYPTQIRELAGRRFSLRANRVERPSPDAPLIVAVHGGGYTGGYFDVPGFSLLARAEALGVPAIALDRPGYGQSEVRADEDHTHAGNAAVVTAAVDGLWAAQGQERPGVVLVGHSIGGAIALMVAAGRPAWVLGVAASGVGLANAPGDLEAWQSLPPVPFIEFPAAMKDAKMFGAEGTYVVDAPARSHAADAPAPRQELIDIVTAWPQTASSWLGRITAPVHYRQGGDDGLWQVSAGEVARFAVACGSAAFVDAALVERAGHCIDFHRLGAPFQLEQLAFALRCAASRPARS